MAFFVLAPPSRFDSLSSLGYLSFNAVHSLECSSDGAGVSPRCISIIPRNVPSSVHEAISVFFRVLALPQDGKPTRHSNDNSARSSTGTGAEPRSPLSPRSHDDSVMSDAASTSASHNSPGHSVAVSEVSRASSSGHRYRLEVIQHPERTAECAAILSRLPLSPPLVVKIIVEDADGNVIPAHTELPFLAAHLALYSEDGTKPIDVIDGPTTANGSSDPERLLYGTLVSSLHHLKDTNGEPGVFFIFPDVSVRRRGTYTLVVNLLTLTNPEDGTEVMPEGMANSALASARTNPFVVVAKDDFSAPASTPLTNCFHRQGARMYTPFQPR